MCLSWLNEPKAHFQDENIALWRGNRRSKSRSLKTLAPPSLPYIRLHMWLHEFITVAISNSELRDPIYLFACRVCNPYVSKRIYFRTYIPTATYTHTRGVLKLESHRLIYSPLWGCMHRRDLIAGGKGGGQGAQKINLISPSEPASPESTQLAFFG